MAMKIKTDQYKFVKLSVDNHILRVQLDRPPVNALNKEFVAELHRVAKNISTMDDVWEVVVSSSGSVFCAGADLKERALLPVSQVGKTVREIQLMVRSWFNLPQPVVMLIQGAALGGGMEFALAGDIIIASDKCVLGFPEVSLGIIPAAGGTQLLQLRTTVSIAKKWILLGQKFSGEEALRDGVIEYLFSEIEFIQQSNKIISSLATNAPRALRQAKKAINAQAEQLLKNGYKNESVSYAALIKTKDRLEALRAFNEKRSPHWMGK